MCIILCKFAYICSKVKFPLVERQRVKVKVLGITYSQVQQGAYMLVLAEEDGTRRIPIIVGTAEAQSIAIRLESLVPPRPMTHDLFVSFAHAFGVRLLEVFIYRFENGIFYSELMFSDGEREVRIDSRTSDAIAIAMRTKAPIYIAPEILWQTGFDASDVDEVSKHDGQSEKAACTLENLATDELKKRLAQAVADEAYEEAAQIQQIINARNAK